MNVDLINTYTTELIRLFRTVLVPNVVVQCTTFNHPSGAIVRIELVRIELEKNAVETNIVMDRETPEEVYEEINLRRFINVPNFANVNFSGTNIVNNGNEILFIKDDTPNEWSTTAASNDLLMILKEGRNE